MNRRQFIATLTASVFIPSSFALGQETRKLVIHCGVTMSKAIHEMGEQFKQLNPNVEIVILRGGSQDLYDNIVTTRVGDLYLPGEPSYIFDHQSSGLFSNHIEVGYNQAAFIVAKGNPKQVKPDLQELLRKDLITALSTPEQSSIGLEIQAMLTKKGLYEVAIAHASQLMADGRVLVQAVQKGESDLCISWKAGIYFAPKDVEIIELPEEIATKNSLLLTKLNTSTQPELVDKFMQFAISDTGQAIMRRYGF